jgi:MFS family permease
VLAYSPLQVGILLLPATLGRVAGELAAGHLSDRWGARGLSLSGLIIFAMSCAGLGQVHQGSSVALVGVLLVLGNTGMALTNSPIIHAGLRTLHDEQVGMGSGVLSLVRITGGTFGVGVVGPLVALAEPWVNPLPLASSAATPAPTALLLNGYHLYFLCMALLIVCTMIPAWLVQSAVRQAAPACRIR